MNFTELISLIGIIITILGATFGIAYKIGYRVGEKEEIWSQSFNCMHADGYIEMPKIIKKGRKIVGFECLLLEPDSICRTTEDKCIVKESKKYSVKKNKT